MTHGQKISHLWAQSVSLYHYLNLYFRFLHNIPELGRRRNPQIISPLKYALIETVPLTRAEPNGLAYFIYGFLGQFGDVCENYCDVTEGAKYCSFLSWSMWNGCETSWCSWCVESFSSLANNVVRHLPPWLHFLCF